MSRLKLAIQGEAYTYTVNIPKSITQTMEEFNENKLLTRIKDEIEIGLNDEKVKIFVVKPVLSEDNYITDISISNCILDKDQLKLKIQELLSEFNPTIEFKLGQDAINIDSPIDHSNKTGPNMEHSIDNITQEDDDDFSKVTFRFKYKDTNETKELSRNKTEAVGYSKAENQSWIQFVYGNIIRLLDNPGIPSDDSHISSKQFVENFRDGLVYRIPMVKRFKTDGTEGKLKIKRLLKKANEDFDPEDFDPDDEEDICKKCGKDIYRCKCYENWDEAYCNPEANQ